MPPLLKLMKLTSRPSHLAVGVVIAGLSIAWISESFSRNRAERRYQAALKAQQHLELEVGELRVQKEHAVAEWAASEQRALELDRVVTEKETQLQSALDRLAKEGQAIQELEAKMIAMQLQFDRVQGELAVALEQRAQQQAAAPATAVQLDKVVVTQPGTGALGLEGRILSINPQWKFVVVDLGWNVVELGDVVSIYRGESLIGKARVERVQEQVAAATLLPEWTESEIQVNDVVRVL